MPMNGRGMVGVELLPSEKGLRRQNHGIQAKALTPYLELKERNLIGLTKG